MKLLWKPNGRQLVIVMGVLIAAAALIASLGGARAPTAGQSAAAMQTAAQSQPAWPTKRYPRMTRRLGADVFDRAALLVPQIASAVEGKTECDQVRAVEMLTSSTPRSVRYLATCANGYEDRLDIDFTKARS